MYNIARPLRVKGDISQGQIFEADYVRKIIMKAWIIATEIARLVGSM